jgi:hypothetical protein
VETLIEQRVVSSPGEDPRLVRISVGLEELEDLKADLLKAFAKVKEVGSNDGSELRKTDRVTYSLSFSGPIIINDIYTRSIIGPDMRLSYTNILAIMNCDYTNDEVGIR